MKRTLLLAASTFMPALVAGLHPRQRPHALGAMFTVHMALLYAMLRPTCQWLGPVFTRFVPAGREVWLTIDDGPHPADTARMLDLLFEYGAKATFFVVGERARRHPLLCREIVSLGHTLANHTDTHPSAVFWAATEGMILDEVDACQRTIESQAPRSVQPYFRPPAGLKSPFLHPALLQRGLMPVCWSARGYDSAESDPEVVAARIGETLSPGAILLLHQGKRPGSAGYDSPAALKAVLELLRRNGYRTVLPEPAQLIAV